jgi:hypothetical protein
MIEHKLKHLEFIQRNITRMSTNSFLIKGWSITLLSALFALAQKESSKDYVFITYFAVPLFWYLNGFFLLHERKFRKLYDKVREKSENTIDFSMDTEEFNTEKCTLISSIFSRTIWPIYLFMIFISLLIMFGFK